jgi:ATP-binding cassette subfamily F protein 1
MEGDDEEDADLDHLSGAWDEFKREGGVWGGKGKGGRGIARRYACMSVNSRDVLVENFSVACAGKELIEAATLRILHGRTYALMGRNGVGKSILLLRMAKGKIPGFPLHLRVALVAQEEKRNIPPEMTVMGWLTHSVAESKTRGLEEQREILEERLDQIPADDDEACRVAELLGDLDAALEEAAGGSLLDKATKVLHGLGFTDNMQEKHAGTLSGGWRMRLQLAEALLLEPDLLLLDEPTNHLDLHGVLWLENYLVTLGERKTAVIVSHDREFLGNTATDVIVLENKTLTCFPGTLDEYEGYKNEAVVRQTSLLDARVRQERKAREAAEDMKRQAARSKGGVNDGQLRQAKQKLDKIGRIGLYRCLLVCLSAPARCENTLQSFCSLTFCGGLCIHIECMFLC